jgi:hypothetical protein
MVVGASCTPPFWLQGLCRLCQFCVLLIHLGSPLTRFWSHVSKAVVAPSVVVNDIVVVTSPSMASHEGLRDPKANDGDQAACGLSPRRVGLPLAHSKPDVAALPPSRATPPPSSWRIASWCPLWTSVSSSPGKTTSRRRRFGCTSPSMSFLVLMRRRNSGRCRLIKFRFVSSFLTKCSFCRTLWSHVSCLASSRSSSAQSWLPPFLVRGHPEFFSCSGRGGSGMSSGHLHP